MDLSKKIVYCFTSLVLYIFLKQTCINVQYFVLNYALLWFWGYARETLLDHGGMIEKEIQLFFLSGISIYLS